MVKSEAKRTAVAELRKQHGTSERRACRLVGLKRSTHRYRQRKNERRDTLRARMGAIAGERQRFGYRRITALLRREGWQVNHKCVHRICREQQWTVPKRRRKRIRRPAALSVAATRPNQRWAMDYVSDSLASGHKIRALTIVDTYTRECVAWRSKPACRARVCGACWRVWRSSDCGRRNCGSITVRSSSAGLWPLGAKRTGFGCGIFSPASRYRMDMSKASTTPARRVSECELVYQLAGCALEDRRLAARLQ